MKDLYSLLIICLLFIGAFQQNPLFAQDTIVANNPKNFQKLLDSATAFYNQGDYTKSLVLNIDVLKMAYTLDDPYYLHQGYRSLAYDYLVLNDTINAMTNMKKSEHYAGLSKNDTATAVTYMDLANIYSINQNYKKAYHYHDKSITQFNSIKDSIGLSKAHYNYIYTAIDNDDYERAYVHILKSKQLLKFEDHHSYCISLDGFLGEYYLHHKDFRKADELFLKTIEAAKKEELRIELENIYYFYSISLYEQEKFKEAYDAFEIYDEYSDENSGIYTAPERYAITDKIQLDQYRKDAKTAQLNSQLQAQISNDKGRLNTLLIIVAAIFLLLLISLFVAFLKRKTLVKELKIKNKKYLLAKEESEKLSKAKNNFFSTVSHELRTPLYGVIGLSTILMEDESLKSHEKDLKSLKFSADYLLALINDVLQINKIDAKNIDNDLTSFNLRELIETIIASFEYMRLQNNNKININISKNVPGIIRGNSVRLSQVLMNLISNACKFTENGAITISINSEKIDAKNSTITFIIKDTGIGIAKNKQEGIFDEFSQIDSLDYSYQGTGLGLPIVKKLLAHSNSEIYLESDLGKGSSFTFAIDFEVLKEKVAIKKQPLLDVNILKDKKILIVEDNRINQIVTAKILEKNKVICFVAENGDEAVNMIKNNTYDLVLMDINMPIKNGIDATKEIRLFNTTLPILALTAVEVEEMRFSIYESGMNDIIVKPYDVTKFIQTIIKNMISVSEKKEHLKAM
ncbi:MAG: signal transduction histidine kinase/CheY-like chemotaxis protein [Flavobacteriaceae bacterium]|jgi:signal transduction histidine kinase/CheY-like chemotaxis protein|uniref:tetratricopeptide repeat-containing hybrid sensor histidine kinase/response regulator n=1 Tax=Candidatus Marifrigoribacter sp. Uisw_064 TaxID=3230970 RepID=UPI003AEDEC76